MTNDKRQPLAPRLPGAFAAWLRGTMEAPRGRVVTLHLESETARFVVCGTPAELEVRARRRLRLASQAALFYGEFPPAAPGKPELIYLPAAVWGTDATQPLEYTLTLQPVVAGAARDSDVAPEPFRRGCAPAN